MIQKIKKALDIYIYIYTKWAKNQYWKGGQQFKFSCFPTDGYLESEVAKYLILHGDNHV